MGGTGGVVGGKWRQMYLNNNKKMSLKKDKERILKAEREKETVTYKGLPIRLSADFSKETLQARRG